MKRRMDDNLSDGGVRERVVRAFGNGDCLPPENGVMPVTISRGEARVLAEHWARTWRGRDDLLAACVGRLDCIECHFAATRPQHFVKVGLISQDEVDEIF